MGMHTFFFLAAERWNVLPHECRQAVSLPEFVSQTNSFLGFPVEWLSLLGVPYNQEYNTGHVLLLQVNNVTYYLRTGLFAKPIT